MIKVTHPERVLFPDDGFTKADLVEYHSAVAPALIAHLHDRPVMLQRFPEGIAAKGFYQKDRGRGMPGWVRTVEVPKRGGVVHHPVVDDRDTLVTLSNLSTISFHRWLSRADQLDRPDLLVVDLDPSTPDFDEVRQAARWTRDLFDELDLTTFLMVTGSRGLHVVVPLDRSAITDEVRSFADDVARVLAARHPDELTHEFSKEDRRARLYLDTARNGYAQTTVAPYSVRPRAGAPVAVPITWDELDDPALRPDGWTIETVPDRLATVGDPWEGIGRRGRALGSRRAGLDVLLAE